MAASEQAFQRFPIPAVTADAPYCTQEIIRRSRFLAQGCHCVSRASAINFVESIRTANRDATHNCWAYVAGAPGDTACIGSSDDGEPHGTAGRPMLNALLHSGIGQICVVVSRWFGGIKLGTGGLTRAYQEAVQKNVATMPLKETVNRVRWRIVCQYAHLASVKRCLDLLEAEIEDEAFDVAASITASVPECHSPVIVRDLADVTNGSAEVVCLEG